MFSKQLGHNFTSKTMLLSGSTGHDAIHIGGKTTHCEHKLLSKGPPTRENLDRLKDTRLHVIDGVSVIGHDTLSKLNKKLRDLTQEQETKHGSHPVVLMGDFRQIQPRKPICESKDSLLWEGTLDCMVELKASCKQTGTMKDLILQWREMGISQEQRDVLNMRVVGTTDGNNNTVQLPDPFQSRWAKVLFGHSSFLNASLFKHHLTTFHSQNKTNIPNCAIVICAVAMWEGSTGAKLSDCEQKTLLECCATHSCKNHLNQHCSPLLCLHSNCHVTCTNGANALFKQVHLKPGAMLKPMKMHGRWVHSVSAEDVASVELCSADTGQQRILKIKPRSGSFKVNFPLDTTEEAAKTVHMLQVPLTNSQATSGSRMARKSLNQQNLIVTEWFGGINDWDSDWVFSAISTVSSLENLFMTEPLPDHNSAPQPGYLQMMDRLRNSILATPADVQSLTFPLHGFAKSKRKGSCTPNHIQCRKKHCTGN